MIRPLSTHQSADSSTFTLVSGPARSGKSEWAEHLATISERQVIYIATAREDASDAAWMQRIHAHQLRRPAHWTTVVASEQLAEAIDQHASNCSAPVCLLIDSLGTWVANLLDLDPPTWEARARQLKHSVLNCPAMVIVVAEEAGWGVIPPTEVGGRFRDRLGALIRQLGIHASASYLVTGGYALNLTQLGTPLAR